MEEEEGEEDNDSWFDGSMSVGAAEFDEHVAKLLNEENQKSEEEYEQWKRDGMEISSLFDIGNNSDNVLVSKSNAITNHFPRIA